MADSLPVNNNLRKPRKSNFSVDEVEILVEAVRSHYEVLYGPFAKRSTNRSVRYKAWMDILRQVNGVSLEQRTLQEVKNKWKKCQSVLREQFPGGEADEDTWEDIGKRWLRGFDTRAKFKFDNSKRGSFYCIV